MLNWEGRCAEASANGQPAAVTRDGPKATVHASSAQSKKTSNTHVTQIAFDAY